MKTQMGENHEERDSTIIMTITMVFSGVLGFMSSIPRPLSRVKESTIYTGSICLDKVALSSST